MTTIAYGGGDRWLNELCVYKKNKKYEYDASDKSIRKKDTDKIESVGEFKVQVYTNTLYVFNVHTSSKLG